MLPGFFGRRVKRQTRKTSFGSLNYQQFEPRKMLATLADAGISQAAIDVIDNVNGTFQGDIGDNNNAVADIVYTNLFLNDVTVENTLDAIISSESIPANPNVITNVAGLSSITAGTDTSPKVYLLVGDFTITSDIDVPSNVHIYLFGSITYVGTYTTPDIFNNGSGESENREEAIFRLSGSRNVKLIGIDNAQLIGNPNLHSSNPHVNGVLIRFSGSTNVEVEGFEMRALWQGVTADFGTSNITVKNNYIVDSVKRGIWFLGTTNSVATHNFVENSGADGIDFDAFVADSVAYENVLLGNGRFAFFVEEGANNNFSVRQVSVLQRMGNPNQVRSDGSLRFMLGNASNGTGDSFVNNNPGIVTRDNFFLDNTTFQPSSQQTNQGGRFIATGDNLQVGNSYFYGNKGYGIPDITPETFNSRDVTVKAVYGARLPSEEITVASNSRTSFNSYDLTALLNQWDATLGNGDRPIRADIAALPALPRIFQEAGGQVVIEAENFSSRASGIGLAAGKTFNLLHDDSAGGNQPVAETASGDLGLIAEFNESNLATTPGAGANVGNSLVGPRVDYDVNFTTPGIYRVFLRLRAPIANDNSIHVGLNGSAVSLGGSGVAVSGTDWDWVDDVVSGTQNVTVNVATPGIHTINLWMREDGVQVDKIVLNQSGVEPTGFGPVESPLVSSAAPTVVSTVRGASGAFDGTGVDRPDLGGTVSFTFSADVNVDAADLAVSNLSVPSINVNLTGLGFSYDPNTFTATWDFANLALPLLPAFYELELVSEAITAVASGLLLDGDANGIGGDRFQETLYAAIPGDANLDGHVDRVDLAIVEANLGVANPTWTQGDFDDDGQVEINDVFIFTGVNSGDVAVTLAALYTDVRPATQVPVIALPVIAVPVSQNTEIVESVPVSSSVSSVETEILPVELEEESFEQDKVPILQPPALTSEAFDTPPNDDIQETVVALTPIESAKDEGAAPVERLKHKRRQSFDATDTADQRRRRQRFDRQISRSKIMHKPSTSDRKTLAGGKQSSRTQARDESSTLEMAKAIDDVFAATTDPMFAHNRQSLFDWS